MFFSQNYTLLYIQYNIEYASNFNCGIQFKHVLNQELMSTCGKWIAFTTFFVVSMLFL